MSLGSDEDPAGAWSAVGRTVLGRYRIEKTLGQGGMGEVLLALDTLLRRRVALKRLLPEGSDRATLRLAILKEARRASRINDPHIAAIHDVLELGDEIVLVMEFVDGVTLRERLARPIPLAEFWDLAAQCTEGLAVAHDHGVIHRDIKPENLIVTPQGRVKILDFGIAKRSSTAPDTSTVDTDTLFGGIAGTPQYMAPEAHLGGTVDERTDLFSLGAVFYEMLTAHRPFEGPSYAAVVDRVLNSEPTAVADRNPAAGAALSVLVARMLAKEPAARFQTAAELMQGLIEARQGNEEPMPVAPPTPGGSEAVGVGGSGPLARPRRARARSRRLIPVVGTIAVAVGLLAAIGTKVVAPPAIPRDRNVALLAPNPGESDFSAFQLGALDLLSGLLQRHTDEAGFQMASFTKGLEEPVRSAAEARKVLGVNLAIVPTFEQQADTYRARLELVDTARNRVVASRTVESPAEQPFQFMDGLYRASTAMLRSKPRERNASSHYGIRGAGTLRFYLQGIGRLRSTGESGDASRSIADLETACRTEPNSAVARAGLARAHLKNFLSSNDSSALRRAETFARAAVALDSTRPEPHRALGAVMALEKHQAEALEEYGRIARLDPTDDDAILKLARTYGRLGQPERERESYLTAIAGRPHCWQPYWWLATWHFRNGNVEESIRNYREMIRRAPDYALGYSSLGGVLVLRGSYPQAIDTLRRSLELRPTRDVFENLGTAYFNSGRFQEAVDAYNQSFQFGTAGYESWVNLGDAYSWLQGRKGDADTAYEEAIRMGRDAIVDRSRKGGSVDVMVPANLAMVFARLGQPDSARIYLGRAVSADSTNPMVGYCAAVTYWQLGEKPTAIAWLQRSVHGGYPTAWLRDSPIFHEWRALPEFRALAGLSSSAPRGS